jgi:putative spermidine/putrescine transport system permease protein
MTIDAVTIGPTLSRRMASRGVDGVALLVLPALLLVIALFIYPFIYRLALSFRPRDGGWSANYVAFFSDPYLYQTISATLNIAVPVTVVSLLLAIPIAMRVRLMRHQRLLTTVLVIPITLGTVLVAEGLLNYLGPQGWFNRTLLWLGLIDRPIRLVHNY